MAPGAGSRSGVGANGSPVANARSCSNGLGTADVANGCGLAGAGVVLSTAVEVADRHKSSPCSSPDFNFIVCREDIHIFGGGGDPQYGEKQ